jgi:hypothetical protein
MRVIQILPNLGAGGAEILVTNLGIYLKGDSEYRPGCIWAGYLYTGDLQRDPYYSICLKRIARFH